MPATSPGRTSHTAAMRCWNWRSLFATVDAAGGTGFPDHHGGQRQRIGQPLPDPPREHLAGRVLQSGYLVEVVVVELLVQRPERGLDVAEVGDPAGDRIDVAAQVDLDPVRVAVQPGALVPLGY